MGKIWIAGVGFDIDAKVVRWDEGPGFDARAHHCIRPSHTCGGGGVFPYSEKKPVTRSNRMALRPALRSMGDNPGLSAVQAVVRQFVLHHDGCPSAASCFDVLHNERGLSCHFLLDNDGTIYQTLDLAFMGFHAAGFNSNSFGIEMSNRGDAKRWPDFYRKRGQKRDVITCRIHGYTYLAFDYTPQQYAALRALCRGVVKALPNLPLEYPQESPGYQAWSVLPQCHSYSGLLGHYHTTHRKWDPGPFDFKKFCKSIGGRMSFPMAVKGDKPEVPEDTEALRSVCDTFYRKNEVEGDAGFFPVAPRGESRLWHGGIHLPARVGTKVFAPFAGRVMVARMGGHSAVGSTNFVLMRHDMSVGPHAIRFFSLYFHLADAEDRPAGGKAGADDAPHWLESPAWKRDFAPDRIVLIDEPIDAGALIGRVGLAGPEGERHGQIHFEIFSADEITQAIQAGLFQVVDGTSGGRFASDKALIELIDQSPRDGVLSRREVLDFFHSSSDRNLVRYYATLNVSEWIGTPDWTDALALSKDFQSMSKDDIRDLVEEQIQPTLWWTDAVARHARLPRDGVVYHYNPIALVEFINQKLQEANVLANVSSGAFKASEAHEKPPDVLGDIDDESGESFVDQSELSQEDDGHDLGLSDLAQGFSE